MKRALTATLLVVVALAWTMAAHAQGSNPCIASSETNCTTVSGPPLTLTILEPGSGWPYDCSGGAISVTATPSLGLAGLQSIVSNTEYCDLIEWTNALPSDSILSNWWVASGLPFTSSGPGSNLTFIPTNCGTGTLVFNLTYVSPCGGTTNTVSLTNTYTVVGVAALAPTSPTNFSLVSSNSATLQIFSIPVSTNPSITNLEIVATPNPTNLGNNLPECWSLNGITTNVTYVSITTPGVYTVICSAGASAVTNIIWVLAPDGDVEQDCTTNGPDLLGYWSFNNSLVDWWRGEDNADDSAGTNNGTLYNVTFTNGYVGNAFYFNGSNSYISFGTNAGNFGTNNFTIDFWMKTSATEELAMLAKRPICNLGNMWSLRMLAGGNLEFEIAQTEDDSSAYYTVLDSTNIVNDGSFHEVTLTRSNLVLSVFIDGNFDNSATAPIIHDIQNNTVMTAGSNPCIAVDGSHYFNGVLDEIKIQIDGQALPWVGNNGQQPLAYYGLQNPTSPWINGLQIDTNIAANLSYRYMEDNGSANINCINGAVSFWFKPDWNAETNLTDLIGPSGQFIELGDPASSGWWSLYVNSSSESVVFQTLSNGNSTIYFSYSITNWTSNNWYQIVLDYSLNGTSLYINGMLVANGPGMTNYPAISNRLEYGFGIGSDHNGSNQIHGIIDELYTFDCPLTAQEVFGGFPGYSGHLGGDRAAFVTVAAPNYAAYSSDGINWTSSTMPTTDNWSTVAYGNGVFVDNVSSTNSTAAYSFDGVTWETTTMPVADSWSYITYGGGKFIALASGDTNAAYSTSGTEWTSSTMPAPDDWMGATYGSGVYVAIAGYTSNSAYSSNGVQWVNSSGLPEAAPWQSVAYGNGVFVAVAGDCNTAAYSSNGMTWSASSMPAYGNWSVTFGNGLFVAISCYDDQAAYSFDGINWTNSAMPYWDEWYSVTYADGIFVAVTVEDNASAYSTDGIHWTAGNGLPQLANWWAVAGRTPHSTSETAAPTILTQPTSQEVNDGGSATFCVVAIGAPRLNYQWRFDGTNIVGGTASSYSIPLARATNAGTYSVIVSNASGSVTSTGASLTVIAPPAFVAIAGTAAAYSYDGVHWLPSPTGMPVSTNWQSVTYGEGIFVAIAYGDTNAAYSTDGIHWLASPQGLPVVDNWESVVYGNGVFVAVANGNTFGAFSYDGISWIGNPSAMPTGWTGLAYGNGLFSAVGPAGVGGASIYSSDGINWSYGDGTLPSNDSFYSMAYGDGTFLVVANSDASASYSVDGINWTNNSGVMPSPDNWDAVAYGDGKFVAVAGGGNNAAYSSNGITWANSTIPSDNWQSVVFGNGVFVAIANGGADAAYSSNGITWTATSLPAPDAWSSVAVGQAPGANGNFPPFVTTQPASQIVLTGTNVIFSVAASGTGPLSYQWQFNGTDIADATNASLTLTNIQDASAGVYTVYLDNIDGATVGTGATLTVVSVGALIPTNCLTASLAYSNATQQTWTVLVATDPTVSNLTIAAIPSPNLPFTSIPSGWSLDGINTNSEEINITVPGIHTVICTAGTSALTNIIWVLTPDGDVEGDCSTNGPALLGYWGFNGSWVGNSGQSPLTNYDVQNPASPWTNGIRVDTNVPANLSYRYMETNGTSNIYCINGAVRFWFKPDWNSGAGPTNTGELLQMGDGTNSLWSLNFSPGGTNLVFQTESNAVLTTYFTESITNFSSNEWYAITLDYSTSATQLYLNGLLVQTGPGIISYPNIADRMTYGFSIGSDHTGQHEANACFDELYTYSCPLSSDQILSNYIQDLLAANSSGGSGIGIPDWDTYNSINGLGSGNTLQVFTPLK